MQSISNDKTAPEAVPTRGMAYFAATLTGLMRESGISQRRLIQTSRLSARKINGWCNGREEPPTIAEAKLLDAIFDNGTGFTAIVRQLRPRRAVNALARRFWKVYTLAEYAARAEAHS